jgi:peptide/nickel transport system permease protein
VARGDLGDSYINHVSVSTVLLQKLPASAELAVVALLLAMLVAIPGGVIAAVKHGTLLDRLLVAFVSSGIAIPGFWLGIMLVLLFAVVLRWLPPSGYVDLQRDPLGNLRFLCLPALTLAILLAAPILRFVRASMLDVLGEEYIRAARSKGLPEQVVVFRHALKNALIPTITVLGLQFAGLLGGAILIEWVFGWPGLGWLAVNSISARDYLVVQGTVLFVATVFVLVNLLVDLLYAVVDPRIRYE